MNIRHNVFFILSPFIVFLCNCHPAADEKKPEKTSSGVLQRYAHIKSIREEENEEIAGWNNYYFSYSDCRCIYGDEYLVFVNDEYPDSKNLMISLEGGGACWPGLEECKSEVSEEDIYTAEFAIELAGSLDQDWNQMMVPYCDGSVYVGDNDSDYDQDGNVDHWHWGFRASSAAANLAKTKFPDAKKIFITGCSGGGYGTFIMIRLIREKYPDANIYVLNESGPGLFNPDDHETWGNIKSSWNLDQLIPSNCKLCDGELIYWYDKLLENDPHLKIGLYSSYQDEVLTDEFLKMKPEGFESLLLSSTGYLHEKYPAQFKRFLIKGNSHCVEDRYYEIEDIAYWNWVEFFLQDDGQWRDLLEK